MPTLLQNAVTTDPNPPRASANQSSPVACSLNVFASELTADAVSNTANATGSFAFARLDLPRLRDEQNQTEAQAQGVETK